MGERWVLKNRAPITDGSQVMGACVLCADSYDCLALGPSRSDLVQCLVHLVERKHPIDGRLDTGFLEDVGDALEAGPILMDEDELVALAPLRGHPVILEAGELEQQTLGHRHLASGRKLPIGQAP